MTPPPAYFRRVFSTHRHNAKNPPSQAEQLVGFDWYEWTDQDALARMLADDGLNVDKMDDLMRENAYLSKCSASDANKISDLESQLEIKNEEIDRLQEKLRLAEQRIEELAKTLP